MDVIVIGGGIVGVATAYQLRAAGHRVCVVERHATVAQGATYGQGGAMLPTPLDVWFGPTFMQSRRAPKSGIVFKPGFNSGARRFVRRLEQLRSPDAFREHCLRLKPLIDASREAISDIENRFKLEFEQHSGVLHVVRHAREWELLRSSLDLLRELEVQHHVLTPEECAAVEQSVPTDPEFAGGVLFDSERTANCALFTKQVKQILDEHGDVEFLFGQSVAAIRVDNQRAAVELAPRDGESARSHEVDVIAADAVVVAAGTGSLSLVERLGLELPLHPVRLHALTAPIAYEERAPHVAVVDAIKRITMSRMSQRMRIAGGAVLQSVRESAKPLAQPLTKTALALLGQATHDWIPGAAKISAARAWEGVKLLSPDGMPVVGQALHPRLFLNFGHGPAGWGLACGSAKVVADLVSGRAPDVPPDTLAALRPDRFTR